jgi:DNA-binding MarR family transcriptional regulator
MDELRELAELNEIEDPLLRCQMASAAIDRYRARMSALRIVRARALMELRRQGHSAIQLAGMLGVTRQQVHRLLREAIGEGYRPEDHEP